MKILYKFRINIRIFMQIIFLNKYNLSIIARGYCAVKVGTSS
jgi:hypothetical protein